MTPMQRHVRRYNIRLLAKEIHNAATCLTTCQATISRRTGLTARSTVIADATEDVSPMIRRMS